MPPGDVTDPSLRANAGVAVRPTWLWFNRAKMERHAPGTLRRSRRIARLGGALAGLIGGLLYWVYLVPASNGLLDARPAAIASLVASCVVGLGVGLVLGPALSVEPFLWVEDALERAAPAELIGGALGLVFSLVVGALIAVPLSRIPDGIGWLVDIALSIVLVFVGVSAGARRRGDISSFASQLTIGRVAAAAGAGVDPPAATLGAPVVVDTSVLIDGRILDVARTGFLPPLLLLPGFVLEELQRIADAGDPLRRAKGRRGLATVEGLQQLEAPRCEVVDVDFPGVPEVDSRLIRLARARGASVMTTDYMLNRLAAIEGLRVLNLNDLALALKPIVSAGETVEVLVVKEGKELHQGVGYLEDGTMVVVENGRHHIDETVTATVTSVIQTPAGRMIFALVPPAAGGAEVRTRSGGRATPRPRVVNR